MRPFFVHIPYLVLRNFFSFLRKRIAPFFPYANWTSILLTSTVRLSYIPNFSVLMSTDLCNKLRHSCTLSLVPFFRKIQPKNMDYATYKTDERNYVFFKCLLMIPVEDFSYISERFVNCAHAFIYTRQFYTVDPV